MIRPTKHVCLNILVPKGDFCWDGKQACIYFAANYGGATCKLNFWPEYNKDDVVLKPIFCKNLKPCEVA
jgi:hypothetical protein